jgi:hypothetical protein
VTDGGPDVADHPDEVRKGSDVDPMTAPEDTDAGRRFVILGEQTPAAVEADDVGPVALPVEVTDELEELPLRTADLRSWEDVEDVERMGQRP